MRTRKIRIILNAANHLSIPKALLDELNTCYTMDSINTCGYAFANSHRLVPDKFNEADLLPCCIIHDWRRSKMTSNTPIAEKYKYDIEFTTNILTTINLQEWTSAERKAITEICFMYAQCVMADQVVVDRPMIDKLANFTKVVSLIAWLPVKAIVNNFYLLVKG